MGSRWGVLAILCLARVSMGLHLQVVAAVAPFLVADQGYSYTEIGTLIGVFMLAGVALAIPGGVVSRRFGDKNTLLGGLALLMLGTGLLAASETFGLALIARVVSGAGGTLLTMQVAKIATDWFAGRDLSTAIGVLLGTFPLGVALAMVVLPTLAQARSWRVAVALVAVTAVAILLVVAAGLRERPPVVDTSEPGRAAISRREMVLAVLAGGAFALLNAGLVIFTSFTPPLLAGRGFSEPEAARLASWTSWVLIGTLMLAGVLLDRARHVTRWLVASAVLSAGVCLGLPLLEPAWLWIVLFGIAIAPIAVGSMALPGEVLRPESRATGFGLFFTANYVGFGLLPAVAGYVLDATGSTAAPLWFDGLVFVAIVPAVLLFRWVQHRAAPPLTCALEGERR